MSTAAARGNAEGGAGELVAPLRCRIAVIAARWNEKVIARLLAGCEARLGELKVREGGGEWRVFRVPGSYELPLGALEAAENGWDAVICLGCVIRGETWHFEAVADGAATGIREVGLRTRKPVIFGVLTVENEQQAMERTGGTHGHAGIAAADAAVEMLLLQRQLRS